MAEQHLEQTDYDVIILGTGFVESIVAGALSRVGKKVLHLDANDYYGGASGSHTIQTLEKLIQNETSAIETPAPIIVDNPESDTFSLPISTIPPPVFRNGSVILEDRPEIEERSVQSESRMYSIDVSPSLLLSNGPLVSSLISSSVGRYLEFKCLDKTYVYHAGSIQPVPSSKGDVFKSKMITLLERRTLMKFLHLVQETQDSIAAAPEGHQPASFYEFVKSQGLGDSLQAFVLYAIAMAVADQRSAQGTDVLSYMDGLRTMRTYLGSLLKYGPTPMITPIYGASEIPQAFCRLAAVYGAVYVLRRSATSLVLDGETNEVTGIVCSQGQSLKCKHFISSPTYLKSIWESTARVSKPTQLVTESCARLVCVTDSSITTDSENLVFLIVPPNTPGLDNPYSIHVIQSDSSLSVAPKGRYVIHFTTTGIDSRTILEAAARLLLDNGKDDTEKESATSNSDSDNDSTSDSNQAKKRDIALWSAYFELQSSVVPPGEHSNFSPDFPVNLLVCSDGPSGPMVDYERALREARDIFKSICPDEEFLLKAPNPEDVVWQPDDTAAAPSTEYSDVQTQPSQAQPQAEAEADTEQK